MLQEDQSIEVNYCDVVAGSLLGIQGDLYSTILRLRDEVVILGTEIEPQKLHLVVPSPTPTLAAWHGYIVIETGYRVGWLGLGDEEAA
jgi:hypothetical protein